MQALYGNLSVFSKLSLQICVRKGVRQELIHRDDAPFPFQVGHDDLGDMEFGHDLPAGAAGRTGAGRIGDDGNSRKVPLPFGYGLEDSRPFGTVAQGITGILDIAAAIDLPRRGQDSGADGKMRIRAVRMSAVGFRFFYEFFISHSDRHPFKWSMTRSAVCCHLSGGRAL